MGHEIGGLPTHILLIHAVIVLIPLTALAVVLHAAWPAAGRRLGIVTPLLGLVSLGLVPLTTHAGEWLKTQLPSNPAIELHQHLGDSLLPWVGLLFLASVGVWWFARVTRAAPPVFGDGRTDGSRSRAMTIVVTLVALLISAAALYKLYRVGESGSRAVWGFVIK